MLKKIFFVSFVPVAMIALFIASSVFVFTSNYGQLKQSINDTITTVSIKTIYQNIGTYNIDFESLKNICNQQIDLPQEYSFAQGLCSDIQGGKLNDLDSVIRKVVAEGSGEVLKPIDDVAANVKGVSLVIYVVAALAYVIYLFSIFLARKEGMLFYLLVTIISLLLLLLVIGWITNALVSQASNDVLAKIPPELKAPALEVLTTLRDSIIPKIKNDAFTLTSIMMLLPLALWGVHRLAFPQGRR
ncbi:MAG: hypothetical protein D6769_02015 [Methanobacteriota archaeon]|nr:MAG: hypothetical protein D6769_02015 [Euryarchaeota archaeon]